MNYREEYSEYWSRGDRWGSHSFKDPAALADQIQRACGKGPMLDVGCGMGLLVQTLVGRGIDAKAVDIAERVVEEGNKQCPGHFHLGSILSLPFENESFDTVISTDCLEHIAEADVPQALKELHRVSRRSLFIQLATRKDRDGRWHLTVKDRAWWESQFFAAGFRKHPLSQCVVSYEDLEAETWQITMLFEKIPRAALAKYPQTALKAERDLHMDMLREPGRRSDAHLARYMLAREFLPQSGLVVDAACGLGYGTALLAQSGGSEVRVVGLDVSEYAVDYANANYASCLPNAEFNTADVCDLSRFEDSSVDLVASFETVEHLRNPETFLREVKRILKPDGRFICSVPNLWVDETGKDPNPWHFHVFDFAKLAQLIQEFFHLDSAFAQTAGGGMKLSNAPRSLRQVSLPVTSGDNQAEWWLAVGRPKQSVSQTNGKAHPAKPAILLLNQDPAHPLFASWLAECHHPLNTVRDVGVDFEFPENTGLLITADTYHHPHPTLLRKAVEKGIPTLVLADGILEYRNTFEHPDLVAGTVFQPVLGHKIACLGRSQARYLESWGNAGKCEIVGMPRFDRFLSLKRRTRQGSENFKILILTANNPYFTETHHVAVRESLHAIKRHFETHPKQDDVAIDIVWRLTKGLDREIGVESKISDLTGVELAQVLHNVDAVITTPSTTMLEAMMLGLPVAVLDFCNVPLYVQPAWRITAEAQIGPTVKELLKPPAAKMLFQETTLHDALECHTPAAPRMVQLVESMIAAGIEARAQQKPTAFADTILPRPEPVAPRENRFRLRELFPEEATFQEDKVAALQVELAHLRKELIRTRCSSALHRGGSNFDRQHALLQHLEGARLGSGTKEQMAVWDVPLEGLSSRALLLQPPAELAFDLPTGLPGIFTADIALHPDVWEKPESGACEFQVQINRRQALAFVIDPIQIPSDRRWHPVQIEVPASPSGNHQIVLRTRSIGRPDYRWALWRQPQFTWRSQAAEQPFKIL